MLRFSTLFFLACFLFPFSFFCMDGEEKKLKSILKKEPSDPSMKKKRVSFKEGGIKRVGSGWEAQVALELYRETSPTKLKEEFDEYLVKNVIDNVSPKMRDLESFLNTCLYETQRPFLKLIYRATADDTKKAAEEIIDQIEDRIMTIIDPFSEDPLDKDIPKKIALIAEDVAKEVCSILNTSQREGRSLFALQLADRYVVSQEFLKKAEKASESRVDEYQELDDDWYEPPAPSSVGVLEKKPSKSIGRGISWFLAHLGCICGK